MPSEGADRSVDIQLQVDALRRTLEQTQQAVSALARRGSSGSVVTRWAGHTVALYPDDELVAQRDQLISALRRMAAEADALLASRRWRFGHFLARLVTLPLPRRRHELASTRLRRLLDEIAHLQPVAAQRTAVGAPAVAAPTEAWSVVPAATYDLVVLGNVPWASRWQRPQQMATAHAAGGHRVFYVATTNCQEGWEREVAEGVFDVGLPPATGWNRYEEVADPVLVSDWMLWFRELAQRHRVVDAVVHVHLASWQPLAAELRDRLGWRVVYDCMDEWEGFPGMGREVVVAEARLAKEADLVIATAEVLRHKMSLLNPNTLLVRNGVQEQFVAQVQPGDLLADLPHPLIGFTGAVAEWIDIDLLVELATLRPDWTFALLGDIFVPVDDLRELPNVHLLGLQPYAKVPGALFWIDVAIIPFRVDEISHAVDPVKFYEYAASGTPVVSTRMPELDRVGSLCRQVEGAHGFVAGIEAALAEGSASVVALQEVAAENTWEHRYQAVHEATLALWPKLSVVVVTWGELALTRRCLDTLFGCTTHPNFEVIVVDNASPDGTVAYLQHLATQRPNLTVIANDRNLGFAAANNQGLAAATGDVLVLLNNDTELARGWQLPLLAHLTDQGIGLVGPRSDNVGNEARIATHPVGHAEPQFWTDDLYRRHRGECFDIHMLAMFCLAMRRDTHERIGPLDEGYGIGMFEDDDYAERARQLGLRVVCANDAFVRHVGQGSFRRLIENGEYNALFELNRARFEARWGAWRAQDSISKD